MAVVAESNSCQAKEKKKRTKDPGIRIVGRRIYDPNNGKTCHQCRQKTMDFMVSCKKMKKENKLCTMNFCYNCLFNRYGWDAEEVDKIEDWSCPKCRNACNCSLCMRQRGYRAIGFLTNAAKQNGFKSVQDLLDNQVEALKCTDMAEVSCSSPISSFYKSGLTTLRRSHNKKKTNSVRNLKYDETVENGVSIAFNGEPLGESFEEDIVLPELPQGSPLVEIAGVEFPQKDLGNAFQFLEFCELFAKVLDIEKGQPTDILRDLASEPIGCRGLSSPVVTFNVKLLSVIEEDINDENWVEALGRCITGSKCLLENLPEDTFEKGLPGYDSLELSEKLMLLNFLCDEILGTEKLRNYIVEDNTKFRSEKREIRDKVKDIRKEEKLLRQQVRDNTVHALESASTISEHDPVISEMKTEADKKHAELLEHMENLPKKRQRSEAFGPEPILVEESGRAYWKLRSYNNKSNILLQDIGTWGSLGAVDKWYFFNEEEEETVKNHISSTSNGKRKRPRSTREVPLDDPNREEYTDANIKEDTEMLNGEDLTDGSGGNGYTDANIKEDIDLSNGRDLTGGCIKANLTLMNGGGDLIGATITGTLTLACPKLEEFDLNVEATMDTTDCM